MAKFIFSIFSLFILLVGFPAVMSSLDVDDSDLANSLGIADVILKPLVPARNIENKIINVGHFVKSVYLETSILEPVKSNVITTQGNFIVKGDVSGLAGQEVELRGLNDKRLNSELCINNKCYSLISTPNI